MTQEEITREYGHFMIPADKVPAYESPEQISGTYKKCSLYEYRQVTYSGSTSQPPLPSRTEC